ncbi:MULTISPECIES: hypothetical protein [unclassified Ruminococcus]|uniref:hypothetical protein n=1 Tax=unclassified Ruminococcus TaxID=2608920 RepID=UPI002109D84A|nr:MULTISPECIES: hypothetical protein [unclassified Ruminococcus]MCQ4022007.1 hypothetical protein [Ruminococcus sp. zg-924]MCQ4114543.1 hypothetical protein [Ruminococcus sp. zg-921]
MSRRLVFCLVLTIAFLSIIGVISSLTPGTPQAKPRIFETEPSKACEYIVKEFYGRVAVFENGKETPLDITDTAIDSLPDFDKQQLKIGVYAANERELKRLLEDYCS